MRSKSGGLSDDRLRHLPLDFGDDSGREIDVDLGPDRCVLLPRLRDPLVEFFDQAFGVLSHTHAVVVEDDDTGGIEDCSDAIDRAIRAAFSPSGPGSLRARRIKP